MPVASWCDWFWMLLFLEDWRCNQCCFFMNTQDFLGMRSQLKARPSTKELLFSYASKGMASGSLSVKTASWRPRPKRVVITAATIKSGKTSVDLSLDANHTLVASISSGSKTTTLTRGVKRVGSLTVTIVPGPLSWAASCIVKTPGLTVTARQVGVQAQDSGAGACVTLLYRACCSTLLTHSRSSAVQEGFLHAPKKPAGILVRRPLAHNP